MILLLLSILLSFSMNAMQYQEYSEIDIKRELPEQNQWRCWHCAMILVSESFLRTHIAQFHQNNSSSTAITKQESLIVNSMGLLPPKKINKSYYTCPYDQYCSKEFGSRKSCEDHIQRNHT